MNAIKNCDLISLTKLTPSNCTEKQSVKNLRNVLKNHVSTLKLTLAAIRLFQEGMMPDPLVGENACQIRAAIYTHLSRDKEAMRQLAEVAAKVEVVIAKLSKVKIVGKKLSSLVEVLEENGADLQVPAMICPILLGHFLTISKESDLSFKKEGELPSVCLVEANNPKKIEIVSTSIAKEMIKIARQTLSALSIQYMRDEAATLGIEGPSDVIVDQNGLHTSPLLPGMKILLASMKARGTPIVLKNRMIDADGQDKGVVALLCKADRGIFQVIEPEDLDSSAMIIEAASISAKSRTPEELKAEMIAAGIELIILANCAAHTQYGGISKGIEPPISEEREVLKAIALEKGLCVKNPDLCRIYHIFADRIGSHIKGGAR